MRSSQPQRHYGKALQPLRAVGVPVLPSEIVASVAQRRQDHIRVALRTDERIEALERDAAVQDSAEDPPVIGRRPDVIMLRVGRRHRLWIEILGIHKLGALRAEMHRGGRDLLGRGGVIHLIERIHTVHLGFVAGTRDVWTGRLLLMSARELVYERGAGSVGSVGVAAGGWRRAASPAIFSWPVGARTTPGTSGSVSVMLAGFVGSVLTSMGRNSLFSVELCSAGGAFSVTSTLAVCIFGFSTNVTSMLATLVISTVLLTA